MKEIFDRRSIRKYRQDSISRDVITEVLEAAIAAPSAKNRQPWKYYVYEGEEKERLLIEMEAGLVRERDSYRTLPESQHALPDAFNTLKIMREAPVLIIIENTNGISPFSAVDSEHRVAEICDSLAIGASIQNILLTATEKGLGTLWIANTCFAYQELVDHIGIKGQLIGAISMGVPNENPGPRPRKSFDEVIEFR